MRYYSTMRKRYVKQIGLYLLLITALCLMINSQLDILREYGHLSRLNDKTIESEEFRAQQLSDSTIRQMKEISGEEGIPFSSLLTVLMLEENFVLEYMPSDSYGKEDYQKAVEKWEQKDSYETLQEGYQAIWDDLKYFPVPVSTENPEAVFSYSDSWMGERTYGGKRSHEGADIMAGINEGDYYPIVSITDGVIEKIGWLEKGGYRLGIRSPGGAYFYYAHMSSYAPGIEEGKEVKAGELLGYMGSTGYGPEETDDQFDVHLHLGIYIKTESSTEMSVNPYWILRYLDENKLEYAY